MRLKKLFKSRFFMGIAGWLYHSYIALCFRTSHVIWLNKQAMIELDTAGSPLIPAFWHGRLAFIPYFSSRPASTHVMVSLHGDGELITHAMKSFKLKAIRGSSNRPASDAKGYKDRGGTGALREGLRMLKQGDCVSVTPDGPKGPAFEAQAGAILLAKSSGAPIIPLSFASKRGKHFNSWDRFLLPKLFDTVVMIAGEPLSVPRNADDDAMETARKVLEERLNTITKIADMECQ